VPHRPRRAPRRPGVRSPGYGPSGSSGHTLARASAVTGLISSGSGSLHSCSLANGRARARHRRRVLATGH
jgi:hypothetical protein